MQKWLFLLILFAAVAGYSGGMAPDTPDAPASPARKTELKTRALQYFIRASMQPDPAKKLPDLLKALELDPAAPTPLQTLLQLQRSLPPQLRLQAAEGLLKIAGQHPENLKLNAVAIQSANGLLPDQVRKAAENAVKTGVTTPRTAYMYLLHIRLGDLLERKCFEEACSLIQNAAAGQPDPVFAEWTGTVCRNAAKTAGTERRWFGLRSSEREMWQERLAEAVENARKTEADIHTYPEMERRVYFYCSVRCPEDAVRLVNEAVRRFSGNTDAAYLRIVTLLKVRRNQEALDHARKLLEVSPENGGCLRLLAESALRCGQYQTALDAVRKLIRQQPEAEGLRLYSVAALVLQDRYDEARQEIDRVKDMDFRLSLEGLLNSRRKEWKSMLVRLREYEQKPEYRDKDEFFQLLLSVAERSGDVRILEECWQKLDKMGKLQDPVNANNVGYVALVLNHRVEDAGKLIRSALEKDPGNGANQDSMAWYFYKTGDYTKAWEYIQTALDTMAEEPALGVLFDHAGDIALKLGKKDLALQYYRQALGDYLTLELDIKAVQKKIDQLTAE